jgi:hypothetical protein
MKMKGRPAIAPGLEYALQMAANGLDLLSIRLRFD